MYAHRLETGRKETSTRNGQERIARARWIRSSVGAFVISRDTKSYNHRYRIPFERKRRKKLSGGGPGKANIGYKRTSHCYFSFLAPPSLSTFLAPSFSLLAPFSIFLFFSSSSRSMSETDSTCNHHRAKTSSRKRDTWHTFSIIYFVSQGRSSRIQANGGTILTTILFPLIAAHVDDDSVAAPFPKFSPRNWYIGTLAFAPTFLINGRVNGPPDRFSIRHRCPWQPSRRKFVPES